MSARRISIIALAAILLFDVWWRCHTISGTIRDRLGFAPYPVVASAEPLDCDEAIYAYIGKRIVAGDVMYRDLTENKPPLGYWLYALAVAIGGANETCIRLMPLPMVLATIALVWWIAGNVAGPVGAVVAALIYAIMSTDPYLYGNGANMEHAVNLFATASLAFMIRWRISRSRLALILAGCCVGSAGLVKQVGAFTLIVFGLYLILQRKDEYPPHGESQAQDGPKRSPTALTRFGDLLALGLGFCVVWGLAIGVLVLQGAGRAAIEDVIRYGGSLASDVPRDPLQYSFFVRWFVGNTDPNGVLPWPFNRTDGRAWWAAGCWPLWATSTAALLISLFSRWPGGRKLVTWWTIVAWIEVAAPGLFWQHYYLLAVPGVAVVTATAFSNSIAAARRARASRQYVRATSSALAAMSILASILWTGAIQVRAYLGVTPDDLTTRCKGGGQWVVLREVGRDIGDRSRSWDDARLAVWGIHSPLNFYSGLDNVTPQVFTDPLVAAFPDGRHPQVAPRQARTIRDYRQKRPDLIFVGTRPFPALAQLLQEQYVNARFTKWASVTPPAPGNFGLWIRRDRAAQIARE